MKGCARRAVPLGQVHHHEETSECHHCVEKAITVHETRLLVPNNDLAAHAVAVVALQPGIFAGRVRAPGQLEGAALFALRDADGAVHDRHQGNGKTHVRNEVVGNGLFIAVGSAVEVLVRRDRETGPEEGFLLRGLPNELLKAARGAADRHPRQVRHVESDEGSVQQTKGEWLGI